MFQLHHKPTSKFLDQCHSELEAQRIAIAHFRGILGLTPMGRRTLGWLGYKVDWKIVEAEYSITEMIGVWIDTDGGKLMPDVTTDDNAIVFVDKKGVPHLGLFDAEEGLYLSDCGTTFIPDKVVEYLFLPETKHERGD